MCADKVVDDKELKAIQEGKNKALKMALDKLKKILEKVQLCVLVIKQA